MRSRILYYVSPPPLSSAKLRRPGRQPAEPPPTVRRARRTGSALGDGPSAAGVAEALGAVGSDHHDVLDLHAADFRVLEVGPDGKDNAGLQFEMGSR